MTWLNDDDLMIKFGIEEATLRNIGAYCMYGPVQWVEILVDHSELPLNAASDVTILNDNFKIPAGAFIESVTIRVPDEAFDSAGDALVFTLGAVNADRSLSDDTPLGFVDSATQTELNAGGTNTAGWVGSLVGTVLSEAKLLSWDTTTADATAGTTVIRIEWSMPPKNAEDTLVWSKA
jgi:hypothetical protein